MDKQEPFSEIRYFFGGELRLYRDFFESHCPPPMKMNRGMQICRQEETKNWMYYLCRGQLKVYASNYEGNERMVAILGEDSLAGLDCLIPGQFSLMTIECLTDCWLMPLQNTVLDAMIRENPDFAVAITHYYCKILRQLCFDATSQSISSVMIIQENTAWTRNCRPACGSEPLIWQVRLYSMYLLGKKTYEVARNMTYLELSTVPTYMDEFVAACFLPHTDTTMFPSVEA